MPAKPNTIIHMGQVYGGSDGSQDDINGTLTAGDTSLLLLDPTVVFENRTVSIYTSEPGVAPISYEDVDHLPETGELNEILTEADPDIVTASNGDDPWKAFDGISTIAEGAYEDPYHCWIVTSTGAQWIQYTFDEDKYFDHVVINAYGIGNHDPSGGGYYPFSGAFSVQFSTDGTTWNTAATFTISLSSGAENAFNVPCDITVGGKYARIVGPFRRELSRIYVGEIAFYGGKWWDRTVGLNLSFDARQSNLKVKARLN